MLSPRSPIFLLEDVWTSHEKKDYVGMCDGWRRWWLQGGGSYSDNLRLLVFLLEVRIRVMK